jgi:spore coat protein U-like protein
LQIFLTIFVNDTVTAPIRTDHLRPAANPIEPARVRNIYIFLLNGKVDRFSHVLACQVQMSGHSDFGTFPKRLADVFTTRQRKETPDMRTLSLASLVLLAVFTGNALAATQDLEVTAHVVGTCQFNSADTIKLDLGDLDPAIGGKVIKDTTLAFWCTKNASYTLKDENGGSGTFNGTLTGPVDGEIGYTLTYDNTAGMGGGKNSPIESKITATVEETNYVDAPAGDYTDTVTFTVTP